MEIDRNSNTYSILSIEYDDFLEKSINSILSTRRKRKTNKKKKDESRETLKPVTSYVYREYLLHGRVGY